MGNGSFRLQLGDFVCTALSDGSMDYQVQNFFANAPLDQVESALRERDLPADRVTTPYTFLHIDTGEHRVLVDMGAGKLGPRTGQLVQSMAEAGIDPAAIDTVVITHAHPDHVGGALDDAGLPVYRNATYNIWRGEWEFWTSEEAFARAPEMFVKIAREKLTPLSDRFTLLDSEREIVPGIRILPAPGHTPGHMVVDVKSGGQELVYTSDTALHPLHLEHPDWYPAFDVTPEQALATKRRIMDYVAERQALVIAQHFAPFPGLGHVVRRGEGWQWEPYATADLR